MEAVHKSSGLYATIPARVILNNQLESFFRASRRHQIGVFTLSCSVNVYPERIIHETIHEKHTAISIADWLVCILRLQMTKI